MTKNGDELYKWRKQIDVLDGELLRLLNQRAQLAGEVASVKKAAGLPVYDGLREQQILDRLFEINQGPLNSQSLANIFRCILGESRALEENLMRRSQENSFPQENFNGDQYGG